MSSPRRTADETRRIRDLLRASIIAEDFPGQVLPSEEELRIEFAASRASVRAALSLLQDEGLVTRVRGQGTFVSSGRVWTSLQEMHGTESPADDSIWDGRMRAQILDWSPIAAPAPVARLLEIEVSEPVLRIDYVSIVDGVVLGSATNHIVYPEADRLTPDMLRVDFYAMLLAGGIRVGQSTFHIDTSLADAHDAEILQMHVGDPVLVLEQVIRAPDGRPIDAAFCRSCSTRATLFSRIGRRHEKARKGVAQGGVG